MDAVPIWKQIEDEIRRLIALGTFGSGQPVPSVRDLSKDLRVNPATVAKAYQRLTDAGLLEVRRGEGTFVTHSPARIKKSDRREALESAALRYASMAVTMGASIDEALVEVREALEKVAGDGNRRTS